MDPLPVAKLYGFVPSDHGMLQICEKITVDGINVGPSLAKAAHNAGLTDQDIVGLSRFASQLLATNMPTRDVSARNVVKGVDATGAPRFALVDGMGDVRLIPLNKYFQRSRRYSLAKSFQSYARFGLQFNADSFEFTRSEKGA